MTNKLSKENNIQKIIASSVAKASTIAALPIPIVDVVGVVYIQMQLIEKIAKAHNIVINDKQGVLISTLISTVITKLLLEVMNALSHRIGISKLFGEAMIKASLVGISTAAIGELYDLHFKNGGDATDVGIDAIMNYLQLQVASEKLSLQNVSSNLMDGVLQNVS